MSEPTVPQRRWRRSVVIPLLACAIIAGGTWWWFRRLNSVEQSLIGDWKLVWKGESDSVHLRFDPNRRGKLIDDRPASMSSEDLRWFVRDDQLTIVSSMPPVHKTLFNWARSGFRDWDVGENESCRVRIVSPDLIDVYASDYEPESESSAQFVRISSQ